MLFSPGGCFGLFTQNPRSIASLFSVRGMHENFFTHTSLRIHVAHKDWREEKNAGKKVSKQKAIPLLSQNGVECCLSQYFLLSSFILYHKIPWLPLWRNILSPFFSLLQWLSNLQSLRLTQATFWTSRLPVPTSFFFLFVFLLFLKLFFSFIFISWKLITLQYCSGFCHTLTWISHGFTCVPHPDPPSRLPPHPIPLGLPSAPALRKSLLLKDLILCSQEELRNLHAHQATGNSDGPWSTQRTIALGYITGAVPDSSPNLEDIKLFHTSYQASLVTPMVKNLPAVQNRMSSLGREDPL